MSETPPGPEMQGPPPSEFMAVVGLEFTEVGPTVVRGRLEIGPRHHQPHGIVHGGVWCAVIEAAASVGATVAVLESGRVAVGVNNNTNFVKSMSAGPVEVLAEAITQGRTQQLWNVTIRRSSGDVLVATGQVRLHNITPA